MGSVSREEYGAFEEKVRRTVYVDNLSPQVTESVVRTAFGQFGTVNNVHFIPTYMESKNAPRCALVEMENSKQAKSVIAEIVQFPFMMSGMPRPVRARAAVAEMFDDRPIRPGRQISCRWLDQNDPGFEAARKLKRLTQKHAAEASLLLKHQLAEEQKLAEQQSKALKGNYKKYEMIEGITGDGTTRRLARHYNLKVSDD